MGDALLMGSYFSRQVRRAGKRLLPDRAVIQREGPVAFAARFLLFFILLAFLVLYAVDEPWLRWTGSALGLVGLVDLDAGRAGRAVVGAVVAPGRTHLVTTGPCARLRHPLYTEKVEVAIAFALVTAHWVFVAFGIVSSAGLLSRVPREEQMLLEEFGAEYDAYMQRTGRFFPRVSRPGR